MENVGLIIAIVFGGILLLIASGMWISMALGLVGVVTIYVLVGGQLGGMLGILQFNVNSSFVMTAIPLFVFMGAVLYRSELSGRLYKGSTPLVGFLPGGLLHTNILSCAIFAAVSGSSTATAATIGTIAIPHQTQEGYDRKLIFGSIAGGGTLGILIPPSIVMIIYGAMTGQPVGKLFMGGLIPGIALALLFMIYIGIRVGRHPDLAPKRLKLSGRAALFAIREIWPVLFLILVVLGTIYTGVATPTESAALGASGALMLAAAYRKLNWQMIKETGLSAVQLTSWLMFIMVAAKVVSMGLAWLEVPAKLSAIILSAELNKMMLLAILVAFYMVLGCFILGMAVVILTIPVVCPVLFALGFDPIWVGVLLVITVEMGQITPPVGTVLFVVHSLTEKKFFGDVINGVIPFLICMVLLIIIITAFPALTTWLPHTMP